jgi:hypothetical protein
MARNGTGTYTPTSGSWSNGAANGVLASLSDWQALLSDLSEALSQSLSKDGQTVLTGNLQMNNFKLTGMGVGTGVGQPLTWEQQARSVSVISTNTTASRFDLYVLTATLTLTLPPSPAAGDWVAFANRSATATPVIARNGQPIMGLAEDMTLDNLNHFGVLVYADATRGWIFN